jgi:hypothetical protein
MDTPLLTRAEVVERIERFNACLAREHELKQKLVSMKIRGDFQRVREMMAEHDALIAEISRIQLEEMVPIIVELDRFTKAGLAVLEAYYRDRS